MRCKYFFFQKRKLDVTELEEETENKNKVNKVNKLNNKKVKQEVQQEKDTTDEDFQFKFQSQRTPSPQHIKLKLPMSAIGGYNAATVEKKSKMQGFVGFWELNPCDLGGINLYLILSKNTHMLINITCINLLQESPFK